MFLILFCVLLSVLFAESLYFRICEIIPQIVFSDGSFSEPAFIFLQPLFDLSVNALAVQLILVQQCNCRAGLSEYILYTDAQYRSRCFLRKCLANGSAKSADDGMLFYGYDLSGLPLRPLRSSSSSSGLMVWMLITFAEMPSFASISAASSAAVYAKSGCNDSHVCTFS